MELGLPEITSAIMFAFDVRGRQPGYRPDETLLMTYGRHDLSGYSWPALPGPLLLCPFSGSGMLGAVFDANAKDWLVPVRPFFHVFPPPPLPRRAGAGTPQTRLPRIHMHIAKPPKLLSAWPRPHGAAGMLHESALDGLCLAYAPPPPGLLPGASHGDGSVQLFAQAACPSPLTIMMQCRDEHPMHVLSPSYSGIKSNPIIARRPLLPVPVPGGPSPGQLQEMRGGRCAGGCPWHHRYPASLGGHQAADRRRAASDVPPAASGLPVHLHPINQAAPEVLSLTPLHLHLEGMSASFQGITWRHRGISPAV